MSEPHKNSANLATSALMDIISRGQAVQAAAIRDAGAQEHAVIRQQAHDVLDAYLDHMTEAGRHVRAIANP